MSYYKTTKAQRKNRDRIMAWLNDQPFRENSRDRDPQVPDLSTKRVLEEYVPPDVSGAGQLFTPIEMGAAAISYLDLPFLAGSDACILDPCAGIGNLVYHVDGHKVDAFEIESECVDIGQRLFPGVTWHWKIPFDTDILESIEGQYDCVICNPPINTRRGMASGDEMCEGRCKKSEHIFLELCIQALKPEGQALILAPYNYVDRLPKTFRPWLNDHADLEHSWGPLPGEFALTKINLHAWYFRRKAESDVLDTIYQQTAERQHAPGGVVTKVRADWARLNDPPLSKPSDLVQLSLF
jgi:2-polyprenyl-3-methyl-5-hydroxy-6-metoxy-1,4-benzoquinol methylase